MRCVACDAQLSDADLELTKPGTDLPEDMCYTCRSQVILSEHPGYDPRFGSFGTVKSDTTDRSSYLTDRSSEYH